VNAPSTTGCAVVTRAGSALRRTACVGVRRGAAARNVNRRCCMNDFEYQRRMMNWARWRLSERRSFGGSPFPVYNLTPRPPRGENVMPLLAGEADETDRAITRLPRELKRAVEIWFLH